MEINLRIGNIGMPHVSRKYWKIRCRILTGIVEFIEPPGRERVTEVMDSGARALRCFNSKLLDNAPEYFSNHHRVTSFSIFIDKEWGAGRMTTAVLRSFVAILQ